MFFVGTTGLLAALGIVTSLNFVFWISLAIAAMGWIWQVSKLIQPELPNPIYGKMFRQNVGIGFTLLAGIIAGCF